MRRAWLIAAVSVSMAGATASIPGRAGATSAAPEATVPSVRVVGPQHAPVGKLTRFNLVATGAPTLAGFEASLRYDDRALYISRVVWAPTMPSGAALHGLQSTDETDRTTLGAWSCTGSGCGAAQHANTAPDNHLAWIDVVALEPGTIHLRVDSTQLIGANGALLASSSAARRAPAATDTTISSGSGATWAAPSGSLTVAHGAAPRAMVGRASNGAVTPREAEGLAAAWMAGADSGNECGADLYADIDGDGCLTMADVQLAASRVNAADPSTRGGAAVPQTTPTFVVNSTGDAPDAHIDGTCSTSSPGTCTLRAAIQEANAAGAAAEIDFNIAGGGTQAIAPQSALPPLTNPNGITVNGFTQPGSSPNTDPLIDNAVYGIELKGKGPGTFPGLTLAQGHNTIEGLDIHGFFRQLWLNTSNSDNNTIVGDILGLTPGGALDPKYGTVNDSSCIVLENGASHNQIGAPTAAQRNVISGCSFKGIGSYNWPTSYNVIQNNIVGLDPSGTQRRATESHGIDITRGSDHDTIGGTGSMQGNLVSGNAQAGIEVAHEPSTEFNSVLGNLVGTDPTGNSAPQYAANGYWGIHLEGKGDCGTQPCPPDQTHETVEFNVVVGNGRGGVMVDKGTNNSLVAYNKIGVTANGTAAGNHMFGLNINGGAFKITVLDNEIANNDAGVQIEPDEVLDPNHIYTNTNQNTITQNSIYNNNLTGTAALGIDLAPLGKVNTSANANALVNDQMIAPTLSNAQPTSITAATCANCVVELFVADSAAGQTGSGQTYITSATADSTGTADIALPGGIAGQVVTATATDPNGSTSEFSQNVLVPTTGTGNQPPVARFAQSCNELECSFDASASYDPDGSIALYSWDFGDGTTATGRRVQHTYAQGGTYNVRLTVTDNLGATGSTLLAISPAKLPPVAAFTWRCVQLACSFDARLSVDTHSTITTYLWNFGDKGTASDVTAQHSYATAGIYTATLTVADANGLIAQVTAPIRANAFTNVGTSVFTFGSHFTINGTYRPITGDFNHDGKSDILWYAPGPTPDPIWYGTSTGFNTSSPALTINGKYQPLVGDFNGDGNSDIFWYVAGGTSSIWYGGSTGFTQGPTFRIYQQYRPAVGDFNGDGFSDIVWDWPTQASQPAWFGGASGFTQTHVNLQTRGQPIVGDFNGDGSDDIYWYTGGTGGEHLWLGSPFGLIQSSTTPAVHAAYVPVVGDFNGDGKSDILWYAAGPYVASVWYGSAAGLQPGPHVSVNGFYLPLAGDFNGDGKGDVFWYTTGSNASSIWLGN